MWAAAIRVTTPLKPWANATHLLNQDTSASSGEFAVSSSSAFCVSASRFLQSNALTPCSVMTSGEGRCAASILGCRSALRIRAQEF